MDAETLKPPFHVCMKYYFLSVCVGAETAEMFGVMDRIKLFYEIEHINSK